MFLVFLMPMNTARMSIYEEALEMAAITHSQLIFRPTTRWANINIASTSSRPWPIIEILEIFMRWGRDVGRTETFTFSLKLTKR